MATSIQSPFREKLLLVCAVLALVSTAWGDLISVQVTGVVTASDFDTIGIGSRVKGLYTYDNALVPSWLPAPDLAWYTPVTSILSFVDGSSIGTDVGAITVNNNSSGIGMVDEYAVDLAVTPTSPGTLTGAFTPGPGFLVMDGGIRRHNLAGTAWNGIALPDPETVLALLPVDTSYARYWAIAPEGAVNLIKIVNFQVTDLSVVAVPLPGAVLLGVIGLGCCGRLLRRRTM